jgi:23S rRNA pseudouridine1911/1915/1917 synthase
MSGGEAEVRQVLASPQDEGKRLDVLLAQRFPDLSRSRIQRLIDGGMVTVSGVQKPQPSLRVRPGMQISLIVPPPPPSELKPQTIPVRVIYADNDVIVVDKPAGLVVHPAPGHRESTLVNALLAEFPDLAQAGGLRPGIVHRLDKDTSGLMVVARNERAKKSLIDQIKSRKVLKLYLALLWGCPDPPEGTINSPIGRHPIHRKKMAVVPWGRPAVTHYRVLRRVGPFCLVEVRLETGRTHQIRVHFAHLGHPVAGDATYARPRKPSPPRQFLHAWKLGLILPSSGQWKEFTSPLPPDLADFLAAAGSL